MNCSGIEWNNLTILDIRNELLNDPPTNLVKFPKNGQATNLE